MVCTSKSQTHCLCDVNYPYRRIAASNDVNASKSSDCSIGGMNTQADQTLGFEANMDLVSFAEFKLLVPPGAVFGTYLARTKSGHFCVDKGRRTVDGKRLSWLWMFSNGIVGPSNKKMSDGPELVWTKDEIEQAFVAAQNKTLPMFTRHVEIYPELAVTFCLPFPKTKKKK